LLQFDSPGGVLKPFAVLVLDGHTDRLHVRIRRDLETVADPEDAEVLQLLTSQLEADAQEVGGDSILRQLEDTLSNAVRITPRAPLKPTDVNTAISALTTLYFR
jgi:hypothetical protein